MADGARAGRYVLFDEIASGGMGTIHLGQLLTSGGFARTVAIKRLHPQFARDVDFVSMFLDEARLASRVRHPNVVPTLDVVASRGELFLVMDYIDGESLLGLLRVLAQRGEAVPPRVAVAICVGVLEGLGAAHTAVDARGDPLGIVHRDVSPPNVIVGADGVVRLADFGVAKAAGRAQVTREGQIKGKAAYMAPEQLRGRAVDARADVYSASVVLWEMLVGARLFLSDSMEATAAQVLEKRVDPPSRLRPGVPPELDAVVLRGLAREAAERWPSASAMGAALERAIVPASLREVREWLHATFGAELRAKAQRVARMERAGAEAFERAQRSSSLTSFSADGAEIVEITLDAVAASVPVSARGGAAAAVVERVDESSVAAPRRRAVVLAGALLLAAIAGAVLARTLTRVRGAPPDAATSAAVESAPPNTSSAPGTPAAAATPSAATASQPTAPSTTGTAPASHARSSTRPRAPTHAAAGGAHATDCNPPFSVDDQGIRHPKPNCL